MQADYLASELTGASEFTTDWNNVLKLGYDVKALEYPGTPRSGAGRSVMILQYAVQILAWAVPIVACVVQSRGIQY